MTFFIDSSGYLNTQMYSTHNDWIGREYTTALSTSAWHHLAMTWSGGSTASSLKIYLNGTQVDNADQVSGSFSSVSKYGGHLRLGAHHWPGYADFDAFLNGSMGSAQIYDRPLTGAEITQNCNAHKGRYSGATCN
jgi:hypothetical protein